ncbi:MAG: ATP-binding cassette domain-containing protein [Rubrivivax sp.]|nr:MAG: ATP-binding cassette domain-containing protein [Rubrivivax sp.]
MNDALPLPLAVELRLKRPGLDVQAQFRVAPGQVCALVGRPGSGKTALMQGAAGLLPVQSGRITLGSEVMYDEPTSINRPPELRKFAWVDGRGQLFTHVNVRRNLEYGYQRAPVPRRGPGFEDVIAWLDLKPMLALWPHQLSVPQRQRVALARAILAAPNALFLKDPLGEVPVHEQPPLMELLAQLRSRLKLPTVLLSPRIDEVIRLADDVVILHEGRVASAGPVARVLSDVSLSTFLEGLHAGSIVEGSIRQHDIEWLLTEVDVVGQRVTVPAMLQAEGRRVRLKIRARDVNIHRDPIEASSITNQLRGRISQVMLAGNNGAYGAVAVELHRMLDVQKAEPSSQDAMIWGLLTRRSIQQMQLAPGQDCYVSFKAMAVTVASRQ